MSFDLLVDDTVRLVDGGRSVVPVKWFMDGRVMCRIDERSGHGWTTNVWKAYKPAEIAGGVSALTPLIGDCPVNFDTEHMDGVREFGIF